MPGSYGKEGTPLVILKVIVWQYYVMFSDKTLTPNCVCVGGGESYLIVIVYKIDVFDFNTFAFLDKENCSFWITAACMNSVWFGHWLTKSDLSVRLTKSVQKHMIRWSSNVTGKNNTETES